MLTKDSIVANITYKNFNLLTEAVYNLHELLASEIDEQIKELFGE